MLANWKFSFSFQFWTPAWKENYSELDRYVWNFPENNAAEFAFEISFSS